MEPVIQGSDEWHQLRLGKVTASRIADLMAKTKSGYGASRANYMAELIVERLTGQRTESYLNAAMKHGIDTEPQARDAYCFLTDADVVEVGFIDHPAIPMAGASPDGLVGDEGLVEIKCPSSATHIETLLSESVPEKYELQMLWQMACTGRKWCDYVSFDNRMPGDMQLFRKRIHRHDGTVANVEAEVRKFLAELDAKQTALTAKVRKAA